MWSLLWAMLFIFATIKAIGYKIGNLAVILYYAEQGNELPNNAEIQKYTAKVVKKILKLS